MIKFSFIPLGISSAIPAYNRHPSAFVINHTDKPYLIDCGEGTQMQIRKYKISLQKIQHIFITHLHGDHCYGLPGLITTMQLLGRQNQLHIYAPKGIEEFMTTVLKISGAHLHFPLHYHEISPDKTPLEIFSDNRLKVKAIALQHRADCFGYIFEEHPRPLKLIKEKITEYQIPIAWLPKIKNGADYIDETGKIIPNETLTIPPPPPRKFCLITDTLPLMEIVPHIRNADLLYHEATFTENFSARAKETYHSTAKQAAEIARRSGSKALVIGHFSARYKELDTFLKEAQSIFPATILAEEGKEITIPCEDA